MRPTPTSFPSPLPVALAVLTGVALRVSLVLLLPDLRLDGDEQHFFAGSEALASGRTVEFFPLRAPGYIFFCAAVLKLAGPSPDAIRLVQAVLEGLTIAGVFALAQRVAGPRSGIVAAWIYALFPDFIAYSHYLWSETLHSLLLVASLLSLVRLARAPGLVAAGVAGLMWGLASLVKPYTLYLLPFCLLGVVWLAAGPARAAALRYAGAAFLSSVLVVTPWSLAMSAQHGRPILISTSGSLNLRIGTNNYRPPQYDYPHSELLSPAVKRTMERRVGLVAFLTSKPGLYVSRAAEKMSHLWSPNSYAIRHVYRGKYGSPRRLSPAVRLGVTASLLVSTSLVLLLAVPGLVLVSTRAWALLSAAYTLPYLAMITLTPSLSRLRLPLMIFAVIHAATLLANRARAQRRMREPAAAAAVVLAWLLLFVAWSARLPELLRAVW